MYFASIIKLGESQNHYGHFGNNYSEYLTALTFCKGENRLVQSVQDVMKAVTSRTTIPILTGIKITADSEGVTLTGSDSDISIESFIPKEEAGDEIFVIKKIRLVLKVLLELSLPGLLQH